MNDSTDPPPPNEWEICDSEEGWLAEWGPYPSRYQAFILDETLLDGSPEDTFGMFDLESGQDDIPPIPLRIIAELMRQQGWTCVEPPNETEEPPEDAA